MTEIRLISASAGSGKTHRLTEILTEELRGGAVRPEGIIGTTFTVKAAAELRRRVRAHLLEQGEAGLAHRIAAARLGTVHAICGQLVADHAFELGLSPELVVLDEQASESILGSIIAGAVEPGELEVVSRIEARLTWDWRHAVRAIIDAARVNVIPTDRFAECADRSVAGWLGLLGQAEGSPDELNDHLRNSIGDLLDGHDATLDSTKKTAGCLRELERARRRLAVDGELPWSDWAKLGKLEFAKKSENAAVPLLAAAAAHDHHPQLHADGEAAIRLVFKVAARALTEFQETKRAMGALDFVDQETHTLKLLNRQDVCEELANEIDLVLVDEFQDTSPIQLAIFLRLASIAGRSVWVGDQKQAIYGFRGTDPALMDAAIEGILKGKEPETLSKSWRSRPDLVRRTSDLFAPAFESVGIPEARVRLEPAREEPEGLGFILEHWTLDSKNQGDDAHALADALVDYLGSAQMVRDPSTGEARVARAGDIAVLCRTNSSADLVADALAQRGVHAARPRTGLLKTLEGRIVVAGLRLWVDAGDSLAAAELAYLLEYNTNGDGWLDRAIRKEDGPAFTDTSVGRRILAAATAATECSPMAAVDAVLEATGLRECCHRWGHTAARLANVERLRAHAVSFVNRRLESGRAASVPSLVRHLESLAGDEADERGVSVNADTVQVLTWHRAKGLEWPVVVLNDLVLQERPMAALDVNIDHEDLSFELEHPLRGRWLRCWPYPYGMNKKGIPFLGRLAGTEETASGIEQSRREALRLLYVGWTRARDTIVLAARPGKLTGGILDLLGCEAVNEIDDAILELAGNPVRCGRRTGEPDVEGVDEADPEPAYPIHEPREHPPAFRLPSDQSGEGVAGNPIVLGERTVITGAPDWADLGNAIHSYFAVDRRIGRDGPRGEIALRLLRNWQVEGTLPADAVVSMADRLRTWTEACWPEAVHRTEWPLAMRDGDGSTWLGVADLVLELRDSLVLIDHKTFPGDPGRAGEVAAGYGGQLKAYGRMLEAATGKAVSGMYIHMPVLGLVVPIEVIVDGVLSA